MTNLGNQAVAEPDTVLTTLQHGQQVMIFVVRNSERAERGRLPAAQLISFARPRRQLRALCLSLSPDPFPLDQ